MCTVLLATSVLAGDKKESSAASKDSSKTKRGLFDLGSYGGGSSYEGSKYIMLYQR